MAFRNDYSDQINKKLMERGISLNMPEHKFKKNSEIFNECLFLVYSENRTKEIDMYHVLLSLTEYFDMEWLKDNVLDNRNMEIIQKEMAREYNIKSDTKRNLNAQEE